MSEGELIGYSGNCGNSTGNHLHIELRVHGKIVDPDAYITNEWTAKSRYFDGQPPVVTGAEITCVTPEGYDVVCSAADDRSLSRLRIGTWNDVIGIDAAVWQEVYVSGISASAAVHVSITNFAGVQSTMYYSNVYAIDSFGNVSNGVRAGGILLETTAPEITTARIENISANGYDVICEASDNNGISKIQIGTWHDNMNIDDAVWQEIAVSDGKARFHVSNSDFVDAVDVVYHTNAFTFDLCGNVSNGVRAGDILLETTPPVITDCQACDITGNGYKVTVKAQDNAEVSKIKICTWHSNMPIDHARWQEAEKEDGTAKFCIDISDFDQVKGVTYYTKAFAYDRCGNVSEDAEVVNVELFEVPEWDFILPGGTREIGDEAFLGTAVKSVLINDGCESVGRRAFAEPSVEAVYFPGSVQLIQD